MDQLEDLATKAAQQFRDRADNMQHLHPELAEELRRIAANIVSADTDRKAAEQLLGEIGPPQ